LILIPVDRSCETMSQVISKIFGRGHGAKNSEKSKKKDGDPQEGTVASPIVSATSSKTIVGTSMTGQDISQPAQTLHVLAGIKPRPHEQATLSIAQCTSSVHQAIVVPALSPTAPLPPTASRTQTIPSTAISSAPPSPPEQLWDLAYDNLKADEYTLVKAYEKILSRELDENASSSEASELQESGIEQTNPETRRSQMSQLIQAGLKKTERQAKVKQGVGEAMQVVLSAKETIGSAIQSMPQAALAWAGVCLALQVSLSLETAAMNTNLSGDTLKPHGRDKNESRRDRLRHL
jgi:hypothetical protein